MKELVQQSSCEGWDDCTMYYYQGTVADHQFFWIEVGYYEGRNTLLISRKSGKEYYIGNIPHLSPDGTLIVSVAASESDDTNGIWLWKIEHGELRNVFTEEPKQYALYDFVSWEGSDNVLIKNYAYYCDGKPPAEYGSVRLIKAPQGWKLQDEKRPACND